MSALEKVQLGLDYLHRVQEADPLAAVGALWLAFRFLDWLLSLDHIDPEEVHE